jgi:hypothetical protein
MSGMIASIVGMIAAVLCSVNLFAHAINTANERCSYTIGGTVRWK